MIIIEKYKNLFIKIIIILIILLIIVYNLFISKKENNEFSTLEKITEFNILAENIESNIQNIPEETTISTIKVYVTGEVNLPGVIELTEKSRIEDAINLAGGLTTNANIKNVNLAFILEDGQKLYIPNINEIENIEYISTENGQNIIESIEKNNKSKKININNANIEELKKLPGVGESLAEKIFNHRKENGKFKSIEDLKNVNGIGEKKFESLKEYVSI